ncbi:MAG: tRNA (adenosine(37)-N6)-dimethylallyltransferase MiaA [Bacteroidota bacterium]|nr:tRNA (adenosine(37)-N6)-dimethylallyltransferase MiaA [Bacteroidota bacterium]
MTTITNSPYNLVAILGPTATGKTSVATSLAAEIDGEIISADSRQVYRGMDLGTGKDLEDYTVGGKKIPYHLIDIVDAGYQYNVFEYQSDFFKAFEDIRCRDKFPIMCGGSGMYLESVLRGYRLIQVPPDEKLREELSGKSLEELTRLLLSYKSKLHNVTDIVNTKRAIRAIEIEEYYVNHPTEETTATNVSGLIIGINFDRDTRRKRITERLKQRLDSGMIEEVGQLLASGITPEALIYYGLEYKYLTLYLQKQLSYDEMFGKLNIAIHQFAKRQMTWFRGMERRGFTIHWLDGFLPMNEKIERIKSLLLE